MTEPVSEVATEAGMAGTGSSSPGQGWTSRATLMLVLVTLFWGLSFPLMKDWQVAAEACPGGRLLSSMTLIGLRMSLGLVLLIVFRPNLLLAPRRREHAIGLLIGGTFLVGFAMQVVGLDLTTPARSAFITSLGSAWVPLLAWLCWRLFVPRLTLLGLALGIAGASLLSLEDQGGFGALSALGPGELLTFAASIIFAVEILLLDRLGRKAEPGHLTVGFFGISAVASLLVALLVAGQSPGLSTWLRWAESMLRNQRVLVELIILTVFPTVLAFHLMNVYQPRVSASRAALIYLLEPVFSAAFSIPWGLDRMSWGLAIGGALILGGNALVELPIWRRQGVA